MKRPNIFKYAKRELSQDAMVCWLLACLHSTEFEYFKIGLNFIRFIFNDNTIQENEVIIESESPYNQYSHMDVYAVVCVRSKLYPIIFENKINTYLHSGQFGKYCKEKVAYWMSSKNNYKDLCKKMNISPEGWGEIVYVYFKTGYPSGWQKRDFACQKEKVAKELEEMGVGLRVREIYLEDMVEFLEVQNRDNLLGDYYAALKNQKENRDYALTHTLENTESCYIALDDTHGSNESACAVLFENIFGENCNFNYNYQHWASRDLFVTTDKNLNKTYYTFRFQWCKYDRERWAPAFQLQQYRHEKDIGTNKEQALQNKINEAKNIKAISENIIAKMTHTNVVIRFENLKEYPCKSYDSQMLMKVFIIDNSSPKNVCNFIKVFSDKLRNEIKLRLGDSVTLLDYFSEKF